MQSACPLEVGHYEFIMEATALWEERLKMEASRIETEQGFSLTCLTQG